MKPASKAKGKAASKPASSSSAKSATKAAPKKTAAKGKAKKAATPSEDEDEAESEEEKEVKKEVKKSAAKGKKKKALVIPIDEYCPLVNYKVYIDDTGLPLDASLNQTNASNNNNKFYRIQVSILVHTPTYTSAPRQLDRRLQDLDSLGPCGREGPERHSRQRHPC